MCSTPVRTDIPPQHGGGTGPPAPAETVRPTLGPSRRGKRFWGQGEPFVWLSGAALATVLLLTALLIVVVLVNGLGVFWPAAIAQVELADGETVLGAWVREETNPDTDEETFQLKTGNREFDPQRMDFHWYPKDSIRQVSYPSDVYVLERPENGDFFGFLDDVQTPSLELPGEGEPSERFQAALAEVRREQANTIEPIARQLSLLNGQLQKIGNKILKLEYRNKRAGAEADASLPDDDLAQLRAEEGEIKAQSDQLVAEKLAQETALRSNVALFRTASGEVQEIPLTNIVRWYQPNAMGPAAKIKHYAAKIWELLADEPRESNTEGGLFPAIFGTVMLVFLMSIACFPLGVLAGVYLGEYAREGVLVRMVRIAVNNLAGIPSIVYGIFGLGFFVYGLGGLVDQWFFPERAAAGVPTYGTGGILWASMTLGLLTVPVAIVATEEALRTIPRGFREGSYALGATKFQTLWRVLLPMATPGMMTGFILAMARAAGEVAPLMITGVVKLAPNLPLDGQFPFFHPDRKFMHLGFHIFDIAYQSPNVEASKPMVYVTTLLLVLIVLVMSGAAIYLRNQMAKRFRSRTI
ncbi:MAG: phosphate ABC transporter permease PstA [Planctomycetaceae bacterium]|nr:phosphate ABC transporter permease PstA [Planctomycetaceae bacterium]